jgi:hypothetical protein
VQRVAEEVIRIFRADEEVISRYRAAEEVTWTNRAAEEVISVYTMAVMRSNCMYKMTFLWDVGGHVAWYTGAYSAGYGLPNYTPQCSRKPRSQHSAL